MSAVVCVVDEAIEEMIGLGLAVVVKVWSVEVAEFPLKSVEVILKWYVEFGERFWRLSVCEVVVAADETIFP